MLTMGDPMTMMAEAELSDAELADRESREFAQWRERRQSARDKLALLTPREREIAVITAKSINSREAAAALGISVKTVEKHRASAYRRLQVNGVIGLVRLIIEAEQD